MTKYDRFYVLFWNSVKVLPTMSLIPCLWHLTVLTVLFQYKCIPPTGVTMKQTANSFERWSWVIVTITYNFMLHKGIYIVIYLVVFSRSFPVIFPRSFRVLGKRKIKNVCQRLSLISRTSEAASGVTASLISLVRKPKEWKTHSTRCFPLLIKPDISMLTAN